jgi:hypothetical protein
MQKHKFRPDLNFMNEASNLIQLLKYLCILIFKKLEHLEKILNLQYNFHSLRIPSIRYVVVISYNVTPSINNKIHTPVVHIQAPI